MTNRLNTGELAVIGILQEKSMAKPIGLQLYSVREAAKQDFPGTLRRVAEMGYKGIEFAGLHGHDPREIKKIVDDLGLTVTSSHTGLPSAENISQITDTELALGNKRVVLAGLGTDAFKTLDACKESVEKLNTAVELLKPYGLSFGMHNHAYEFNKLGERRVYDMIMDGVPGMFSQLDTYWVVVAGLDPKDILKEYADRIPLLHIKDAW
jgi:sugar phosphate isomerase/epimerase